MRKNRFVSRRQRVRRRLLENQESNLAKSRSAGTTADRVSAFYAAGPALGLGTDDATATNPNRTAPARRPAEDSAADTKVAPLPLLSGKGAEEHAVADTNSSSLRLQGRTDATFDGGAFHTENVVVSRGTGCEGCSGRECVHVVGDLVATYAVTTTVTLPRVSDFPNLSVCQRQRVRDAIANVLAPHEQQHVAAFNTYNGATRRRFDVTLCRNTFDSTMRTMFEAEERTRRSAAQAASDALDPFHFDVDLNCEDRPDAGSRTVEQGSAGAEE